MKKLFDLIKRLYSDLKEADYKNPAVMIAALAFLSFPAAVGYGVYQLTKPSSDVRNSSVMITNRNQNSGGTGVVIDISDNLSTILTNGHVCQVLKNGGFVLSNSGSFQVTSYKESNLSDLCLVYIAAGLKSKVTIANKAPSFYEEAVISGHPALMPNVITKGHFSGRKVIEVMIGVRECTEQDMESDLNFFCMFMGGIPIIKSYESILVTATIMSGSSGSGVYDSNMELAGLVFAGNGRSQLSYAWTVPHEQVLNFLNKEASTIQAKVLSQEISLHDLEKQSKSVETVNYRALVNRCNEELSKPEVSKNIEVVCRAFEQDVLWRGF